MFCWKLFKFIIISPALRLGKSLEFWQNVHKVISCIHFILHMLTGLFSLSFHYLWDILISPKKYHPNPILLWGDPTPLSFCLPFWQKKVPFHITFNWKRVTLSHTFKTDPYQEQITKKIKDILLFSCSAYKLNDTAIKCVC